ncbi:MAG: hypothetical protein Q9159_006626 [Coniocarpon cinnabarinum]
MARPRKEPGTGPDEDKEIHIKQDKYFELVNFLASQLETQKNNASRQIQVVSGQLSRVQESLSILKNHTQLIMESNDLKIDVFSNLEFIHRLLTTENIDEIGTAAMSEAPAPMSMKPNKPKKQRKERDPNAPKRPLTAFFLFLQDKRDETTEAMKKSDPGFKPGDVQKRNTELWNALPEEKQEPYKKQYEANLEMYKRQLAAYKARGGVLPPHEEAHEHDAADVAMVTDPALEAHSDPQDDEDVQDDPMQGKRAEPQDEGGPTSEESDDDSATKESHEESERSEEEQEEDESPPPRKESKKSAGRATKESSHDKQKSKKAPVKEEKKSKKAREWDKSASPERSKKKRKAEDRDFSKAERKRKPRKSQGYNGNDEDF